eukprot:6193020-Pleurochrysis_carterae.AAC.1
MKARTTVAGGGELAEALPGQGEQSGDATPLFLTPIGIVDNTTAFERRARISGEILPMQDLDAEVPEQELEGPVPKSWYVIIGGPFEGVRFGNYDRKIRQYVEQYVNWRAYGPGAGITDEATAISRLREAREQR